MSDAVAAPAVTQRMRQAHIRRLICPAEGDRDDVVEGSVACLDRFSANPAEPSIPLEDRLSVDRRSLRSPESLRAAALWCPQDLGRVLVVVARTGWSFGAMPLAPDCVGASVTVRVDRSPRIRVARLAKADSVPSELENSMIDLLLPQRRHVFSIFLQFWQNKEGGSPGASMNAPIDCRRLHFGHCFSRRFTNPVSRTGRDDAPGPSLRTIWQCRRCRST